VLPKQGLGKEFFQPLAKSEKPTVPLHPASTGGGQLEKHETKNLKNFRLEFGK
jgi:hypothetical protein